MKKKFTKLLCETCHTTFLCKAISRRCIDTTSCYCCKCYLKQFPQYVNNKIRYDKYFLTCYTKKDLKIIELFRIAYAL